MQEMSDAIKFDFYNADGTMKSKEEFISQLGDIYDEISKTIGHVQSDQFMNLWANPENDFDPESVLQRYQFVERKLYLNEEIVEATGQHFLERIQFWNAEDAFNDTPIEDRIPIQIYIDSPGGNLTTSLQIIDAITNSKTPVYTIVTGTAYSGAFFICTAGHKKMAFKNATFLFHEGSSGYMGDAHKVLQSSDFYKDLLKQLKRHVTHTTKITNDMYLEHEKDDWYFDAKKAKKLGVIDEICTDVNGGIYEDEG